MSPTAQRPPSLRLEPAPDSWATLARERFEHNHPTARAERQLLGLPTDRPVIMTGHQPVVWHAGILAKYLACDAALRSADAAGAWLVVDQDVVDPGALRIPVLGAVGDLTDADLRIAPAQPPGAAAGATLPLAATLPALPSTLPQVESGLRRIADALNAARDASSLAQQLSHALAALISPLIEPRTTVFATRLNATATFAELIDAMRADPAACVTAYNRAVAAFPDAGVRPLANNTDNIELPLWRIRAGRTRSPVTASDLPSIPREELAPRALLMTAIARLTLCDLFIHGVGGARYDRITERWITDWLSRTLAPAVVATADLLLPLASDDTPSPETIRDAVWRAHAARHNPQLIGRDDLQDRKRALLESARHNGADQHAAFREIHDMLDEYRREERSRLDALQSDADRLAARQEEARIAGDRAWPFPFHDAASLEALHTAIKSAFSIDAGVTPASG